MAVRELRTSAATDYARRVIVVIGCPGYRSPDGNAPDAAAGTAADIARAAVAAGARVELVGKIGDDATGDALVLALARDGIGHAALLRDPAHGTPVAAAVDPAQAAGDGEDALAGGDALRPADQAPRGLGPDGLLPAEVSRRPSLDAADLSLGLRYLTDYQVVTVAVTLDERTCQVVSEAAAFAGASIVALVEPGSMPPPGLEGATVFEAPELDPDGVFASMVGRYAAALEAGQPAAEAFAAATMSGGWSEVGE